MGDFANRKIADAYRLLHKDLLGFLRARTRGESPEVAREIAHDTFAYWLKNNDQEVRHPRAYLLRVAHNLLRDHWRQQQVRGRTHAHGSDLDVGSSADMQADDGMAEPVCAPADQPEHQVEARQRLKLLEEAIDNLPPRQREAFLLRKLENLSNNEIAARMKISVRMVEQHLHSAMLHCKRQVYRDQTETQGPQA